MADYVTKSELKEVLAEQTAEIAEVINNFANQVDERFNQVDERFTKVDERFSGVDERFNQVDARFTGIENQLAEVKQDIVDLKASHERLLNTVDAFVKRLDDYEAEQAARDAQFARLLEWAREVSKKTGVPLPSL